jgi:hypothetical protein
MVLGPEIDTFLILVNGIKPPGECHLGPQKIKISRAQPPPTGPSNGVAHIKNITSIRGL